MNVYKYLKGRCEEVVKSQLFSVVPNARTRGSRHKVEHRKLPLSIRKYFFIMCVITLA